LLSTASAIGLTADVGCSFLFRSMFALRLQIAKNEGLQA
jgi:hypothetical protein